MFILILALAGVAATSTLACNGDSGSIGAGDRDSGTFGPQTSDGLTLTLLVTPYPPRPRSQSQFVIEVADAQGDPVTGAGITLDMTMPAMPMPPNKPTATEQKPGQYATPVVFTMAGEWNSRIVVATTQGGSTHFDFAMTTR